MSSPVRKDGIKKVRDHTQPQDTSASEKGDQIAEQYKSSKITN